MPVCRCFLAFFVPPLAVFLQEGLTTRHWVTLLLTACGFVPGVAFALYTIFRAESQPPPWPDHARVRPAQADQPAP